VKHERHGMQDEYMIFNDPRPFIGNCLFVVITHASI